MTGEPHLDSAYLMTIAAEFAAPQVIEGGPHGTRRILPMTGGTFQGQNLAGEVLPGGADWVITRPDGVFQLDIRLCLRNGDGALIHVRSSGIMDATPAVLARIRNGEKVPADAYYFRTMLQFETGAAPLLWLNRLVAAGVGTRTRTGMSTAVFALR